MELQGKRIAILSENNYHILELWYPLLRFREAGAETIIVGMPDVNEYKSKEGFPLKVDLSVDKVQIDSLDALVIPGGYAPDLMRRHNLMLELVRSVFEQGKIVATICHAAWVTISAGIVKGKRATCIFAIKDDLINAGAYYVDQEVVQDGNLITSRNPLDLPAFCRTIISALNKSK